VVRSGTLGMHEGFDRIALRGHGGVLLGFHDAPWRGNFMQGGANLRMSGVSSSELAFYSLFVVLASNS
jgi:hypothetical protein